MMRTFRFLLIAIAIISSNYTLTGTDSNNLFSEIILSTIISEPSCFDACGGYIDLTVSGGQAPYTYSWNGTKGPEDLFDICAGIYTVNVTDANGETASLTVVIEEPEFIAVDVYVTPNSCSGVCDGTIEIVVIGGTPPYDINIPPNLCEGNYIIYITDANGCVIEIEAFIFSEEGPSIDNIMVTGETNGQANGVITVFASGGHPPFLYSINNGPFQPSNIFSGLPEGVYFVTVKDANGCTVESEVLIQNITAVYELESAFKLYPNPANSFLHLESDLPLMIEILDIHGIMLKRTKKAKTHHLIVDDLIPGLYLVKISDGFGATYRSIVVQ